MNPAGSLMNVNNGWENVGYPPQQPSNDMGGVFAQMIAQGAQ